MAGDLPSLERRLAAASGVDREPIGSPVDPNFTPTRNDLDALRKDYADMEGREGLPVKVHVAPAVLYLTWPNSQYRPDDGSSPYHCISFHIPKPTTAVRALSAQPKGAGE